MGHFSCGGKEKHQAIKTEKGKKKTRLDVTSWIVYGYQRVRNEDLYKKGSVKSKIYLSPQVCRRVAIWRWLLKTKESGGVGN